MAVRGVYFNPSLPDGAFRQYAVLPLDLFADAVAVELSAAAAGDTAPPIARDAPEAVSEAGAGSGGRRCGLSPPSMHAGCQLAGGWGEGSMVSNLTSSEGGLVRESGEGFILVNDSLAQDGEEEVETTTTGGWLANRIRATGCQH